MYTNLMPLSTTTTAATVFPDRARVTRTGQMQLEIGVHKLEVANLPLNLLPESVRAAGRGTAQAKLLGVSTRIEHFTETPAEQVAALEKAIQAGEDEDAGWLAQIGVLEREQKYLDGL